MGTRAQTARKYHSGAHLARKPGRPGWYIRWVVPCRRTFVVLYLPQRKLPTLHVESDTRSDGCRLVCDPPPQHPLSGKVQAGDIIIQAGEHRVHNPQQLADALIEYEGLETGLRIARGKPGNTYKWRKAGDNHEEAERALGEFLVNRKREQDGLIPMEAPATYTFGQLAEEALQWANSPQSGYSPRTTITFGYILDRHVQRWGYLPLRQITPAIIGRWADDRATRVSGGSFWNDVKVLRALFRLAMQRHYCDDDPTAALHMPKMRAARPKYLTPEQIDVLLDCARENDAARLTLTKSPYGGGFQDASVETMRKWYNQDGTFDAARIRFMLLTALRKSQLSSLTWEQYDRARGIIVLESRPDHTEKSKRVTVLPVPRQAREIIAAQPTGSRYIFPNLHGERDERISQRMARIFAAVKRRGCGHVHLHLLRHTALTALLRHSHDIASVQRFAGHADVKTTARYAWVLDSELKATVEDFNPIPAGEPGHRQ